MTAHKSAVLGIAVILVSTGIQAKAAVEFPERYENENENVIFDCEVEIPDSVVEKDIYLDKVEGYLFANDEKACSLWAEGKEIEEQHESPGTNGYPDSMYYIFTDGSALGTGRSLSYTTDNYRRYSRIGARDDSVWEEHFQEELAFSSAEDCIEEFRCLLEEVGIPSNLFQYDWFSLKQEQLVQLEEEKIRNSLLDETKAFREWKQEDEIYVVYGFQYDQDLPIFHEMMGLYQSFALDSLSNAPIIATYSSRGLEQLLVSFYIYCLIPTEEQIEWIPFEEAAAVVDEKYNSFLTNTQYVVTRAKLFQMVLKDEEGQLNAEPVWRFEIEEESTGRTRVTVVNAMNGKEIPLP